MVNQPESATYEKRKLNMQDDERCCGTGTCIIDVQGLCWCGQQWNGESMCRPPMDKAQVSTPTPVTAPTAGPAAAQADAP